MKREKGDEGKEDRCRRAWAERERMTEREDKWKKVRPVRRLTSSHTLCLSVTLHDCKPSKSFVNSQAEVVKARDRHGGENYLQNEDLKQLCVGPFLEFSLPVTGE